MSTKSFSDFDLIWCVGRPRPDMRTSMTSTQCKVKVTSKNCTFLGLSSLPFWCGAQNWWLVMIAWDLVYILWSPIFKFPSKTALIWAQTSRNVDITRISNGRISVLHEATVTLAVLLVVLHILCMLMWPWPDPKSRSWGFWSSKNWLIVIVWDLLYRVLEHDFRNSFEESYHMTSNFVGCWHYTNFKWSYLHTAWGGSHGGACW